MKSSFPFLQNAQAKKPMAKDYTFLLDGKEISCQEDGNKYFIYEGDKFVTTIYGKFFGGVDEEVELYGKTCRFIILHDKPDFAADGVLLSSGKSYEEEKEKRRKKACIWAYIEIFASLIVFAVMAVFAILAQNLRAYLPGFAAALLFCAFGVCELFSNRKK